jgi:hypothetical protein
MNEWLLGHVVLCSGCGVDKVDSIKASICIVIPVVLSFCVLEYVSLLKVNIVLNCHILADAMPTQQDKSYFYII